MCYWPIVRSRWLDIGRVLFLCLFMDRAGVEVHKLKKREWVLTAGILPFPSSPPFSCRASILISSALHIKWRIQKHWTDTRHNEEWLFEGVLYFCWPNQFSSGTVKILHWDVFMGQIFVKSEICRTKWQCQIKNKHMVEWNNEIKWSTET